MSDTEETNRAVTLQQFREYLDENKITNQLCVSEYEDGNYQYIAFEFPVAREYDEIRVDEDDNFEAIIQSDFIKYRGVKNYEAIWSRELKRIECEVQDSRLQSSRILMRKLAKSFVIYKEVNDYRNVPLPSEVILFEDDSIKITLGACSTEFAFISYYKEGRHIDLKAHPVRYSLKIENVQVAKEEDARIILEKISDSLLYQIDYLCDYSITLVARRMSREKRRMARMARGQIGSHEDNEKVNLTLDYEYDRVPMSLYWFAQNNNNSPIFTYFALYQVLEFYFPIYSTIEIKTRTRNLMKEPGFNINSDADMMRLLSIMSSNNVDSLGDEREQLDNVLRHVITGEEISLFIKEREYLRNYYTSKENNKLSDRKLRLDDNIGIIEDLAVRIYDIRCRIVHNKASELPKKILPVTKEVNLLENEIDVLKYIVRKTIIVNSKEMSLK